MSIGHEIRRRGQFIIAPILGLSLICYFAYHLVEGDRGLIAWLNLTRQLKQAQAENEAVMAERAALERRAYSMRSAHLDRDMLDEMARRTLNELGPNEAVIMLDPPAASGAGPRITR